MDPFLIFATTLNIGLSSGQTAGQSNTILEPRIAAGLSMDIKAPSITALESRIKTEVVGGSVLSGDQSGRRGLQEMHAEIYSVYNFHQDSYARAGVGFYGDYAIPLRQHQPYRPQNQTHIYAAEEGEVSHRQTLYGLDLKLSAESDRMSTDIHNILFFGGNRVAPNLLTYQPLLAVKWHNMFRLTGEQKDLGLSLVSDVDFYFAKKSGVSTLNAHDGLGGTKREVYLAYGLRYGFTPETALTAQSYGYNNLNRGNSDSTPSQFKDGFKLTLSHGF